MSKNKVQGSYSNASTLLSLKLTQKLRKSDISHYLLFEVEKCQISLFIIIWCQSPSTQSVYTISGRKNALGRGYTVASHRSNFEQIIQNTHWWPCLTVAEEFLSGLWP